MRLLPLYGGGVACVDDEDFEAVSQYRWRLYQSSASRTRTSQYAVACIAGRNVYLHLWLWKRWKRHNVPVVEHKNTDGLDCTYDNLRPATVTQNNQHRGIIRSNTTGFKGVTWHVRHQKWHAKISVDSRRLHLGYFLELEAAARAYNAAASLHHGEFAVLNVL